MNVSKEEAEWTWAAALKWAAMSKAVPDQPYVEPDDQVLQGPILTHLNMHAGSRASAHARADLENAANWE